jgi:uncharacterized protein (DUF58 family)
MAAFAFNPNDLQRLNRLVFLPHVRSMDPESGTRRSHRAGDGNDFLDFRPYTPGDDVRKVDWNLYARLRQVFVRLNESPRRLSVSVLIDTSRSMGFGAPVSKLEQAQRLACALGFVAMRNGDRVFTAAFGSAVDRGIGPLTGARGLAALMRYLQSLDAGGQSDLDAAVVRLRAARRDRGLIVIISDFLNVTGRENALLRCGAAGGTVLAVQVLDPIDRGEGLEGRIRLRDSETGRMVDVDLDRVALAEYQAAFDHDRAKFQTFCGGAKRQYVTVATRDNYLAAVCDVLRSKAVLR